MVDNSIGDRVEVRYKAKLYDAAVIHVRSAGTADVLYDIDASIGIYLTAKEHRLKCVAVEKSVLGRKEKPNAKVSSARSR